MMILRKILIVLMCYAPLTWANTHGYLGFWYDANQTQSVPRTKTTRENSSQTEAEHEIQQFCQNQDAQLSQSNSNGNSGCFALTPLQNTCVAAAWSHKRGLLRPDNVYIAQHPDFHEVGKMAHKMCKQNNGWFARCEVETVFCTDREMYAQE